MVEYESFFAPQYYWNNLTNMRRASYIKKYFAENGVYPTQEQISAIVLTAEEVEKFNRHYYANYLVKQVTNEDTPVIPPVGEPQDWTISLNDILGTWEVTSVTQANKEFRGTQFLTFTTVKKNGNTFNVWKGDGDITIYYGNTGEFTLSETLIETYVTSSTNPNGEIVYKKISSISGTNYAIAIDAPWTNEYDITHFGYNDDGDRTMWWTSKDNSTVITFKKTLEINPNNFEGTWVNTNDDTHIITLNRKNMTYTLQSGNTTFTGVYTLEESDYDGSVTIRGIYDHSGEEWEYHYKIKYLTKTGMKWQATTNSGIVYEFVREQ